jgi:DNA-binding CsgD family transcriptional regulator
VAAETGERAVAVELCTACSAITPARRPRPYGCTRCRLAAQLCLDAGGPEEALRDARASRQVAATHGLTHVLAQAQAVIATVTARSGPRHTGREREVAQLAIRDAPIKEIATTLFITERTVDTHLASSYRKLDVRLRTDLIARLATILKSDGP